MTTGKDNPKDVLGQMDKAPARETGKASAKDKDAQKNPHDTKSTMAEKDLPRGTGSGGDDNASPDRG